MNLIGSKKIHVDDWINSIKGCPKQRDTESRAKVADHLKTFHEAHREVRMARLPNGEEYKLDAHTRAFIWANDPELKAKISNQELVALVYEVKTLDEICDLYDKFDNSKAVETSFDKVYGSLRKNSILPQSNFIRRSKFVVAIKLAFSYWFNKSKQENNIEKNMEFFIPEICRLDWLLSGEKNSKKMITPAVICYLMAQKKHKNSNAKDSIDEFFKAYRENLGIKDGKKKNYVQAFTEVMENYKTRNTRSTGDNYVAVEQGLSCIEGWLRKKDNMIAKIMPTNPKEYSFK